MSPHAVNNFVSDLVLMAQAMEKLPQVELELNKATSRIGELTDTILQREDDLLQSRDYAATLEQKVREAEVAKDQAETMFLEADDRTARALEFVKAQFGAAGSLIQALEPPKPQPEPVVSEVKPIEEAISMPLELHPVIFDNPSQGQSEPDPIQPSGANHDATASEVGQLTESAAHSVTESAHDTTIEPANPQPYAGKNCIDHPGFVSRSDWLEGGGTNESYDYRYF